MQRLFRREIYGVIAAIIAAGVSYRAEINYLPSVFLIIAGILLSGVFAELEDEALKFAGDKGIESHDWHLMLVRVTRSIVLLVVAILTFAALFRQF